MKERILRLPEVLERSGLGRATIYRRMAEGNFPLQVKLAGPRAVGWLQSEVDDWLQRQLAGRKKSSAGATKSKKAK